MIAAEISDLAAQTLVFRCRERTPASPPLPRDLLRRVEASCDALLLGDLLPDAFLAAVLGSDGLAGADVRTILTDGTDLVQRAMTRVTLRQPQRPIGHREPPNLGWLQRVVVWLGRRLGLALGPVSKEPDVRLLQTEREYVLARLGEAGSFLRGLVSTGGSRPSVSRLPPEVFGNLQPALHRLISEELRVLSREIPGTSRTPEDAMRALATELRPVVETDLGRIVAEWGIETEQARVFREALKDEERLRFAAYIVPVE